MKNIYFILPRCSMNVFSYAHMYSGLTFTAFPEDFVKASHHALPTFTAVSFHSGELVGQKVIKHLWKINTHL